VRLWLWNYRYLLFSALLPVFLANPVLAVGERAGDILVEHMDSDHNGLVSEEEWHAAMQKRFEKFDANNDGGLSREEVKQVRTSGRESLRERFQNRKTGVE